MIGGMLASTVVAIFFVPLFFWLLECLSARFAGKKTPPTSRRSHGAAAQRARRGMR